MVVSIDITTIMVITIDIAITIVIIIVITIIITTIVIIISFKFPKVIIKKKGSKLNEVTIIINFITTS
jgi:hypothetical protein